MICNIIIHSHSFSTSPEYQILSEATIKIYREICTNIIDQKQVNMQTELLAKCMVFFVSLIEASYESAPGGVSTCDPAATERCLTVTARPIRWIRRRKFLETGGRRCWTHSGKAHHRWKKKIYGCDSEKITRFLQRFIYQWKQFDSPGLVQSLWSWDFISGLEAGGNSVFNL